MGKTFAQAKERRAEQGTAEPKPERPADEIDFLADALGWAGPSGRRLLIRIVVCCTVVLPWALVFGYPKLRGLLSGPAPPTQGAAATQQPPFGGSDGGSAGRGAAQRKKKVR